MRSHRDEITTTVRFLLSVCGKGAFGFKDSFVAKDFLKSTNEEQVVIKKVAKLSEVSMSFLPNLFVTFLANSSELEVFQYWLSFVVHHQLLFASSTLLEMRKNS